MRSKPVCNNGLTLASLYVAGLGIINPPRFFIEEEPASGKPVEILSDYRQQDLDLHIFYPHRRHLVAKVKALLDLCRVTP
ncbi:LysR substrate-binding domain-containing protein [Aggregatibacter actinomycetemcomitans]|uniref:LysR substrate-binding domain-containing protein n=1 Tax=Aggregatibacter actinomycetemcomitans TaxID=714 RepID=UPI001F3E17FF|nr:LysR substrate-binding domain-containing protein [Aggregatibacter actinomycetemcomitans]